MAVNHLIDRFDTSERRACRITGQSRSTQRRLLVIADQELELRSWLVLFAKRRLCAQTEQRGLTDFVMGADATSVGMGGSHNPTDVASAPITKSPLPRTDRQRALRSGLDRDA